MEINRRNFPKVMLDNDMVFIEHLIGIISSVDELCSLELSNFPTFIRVRIAPSLPKYNNLLLEEILKFHNMFSIQLNLSKSIKTSSVISFDINT